MPRFLQTASGSCGRCGLTHPASAGRADCATEMTSLRKDMIYDSARASRSGALRIGTGATNPSKVERCFLRSPHVQTSLHYEYHVTGRVSDRA